MKLKKALVVYMDDPCPEHGKSVRIVKAVLDRHGIKHEFVKRDCLCIDEIKGKDLVISVGGDGTVLSSAHRISDFTPLLGVNSNPKIKEGFLCRADAKNFESRLKKVMAGKFKIKKLSRLDAFIGKRKLTPALNEVFVGNRKPYLTALYEIRLGKTKEFQKSSGVIVCTPTGSNSWCTSAGGKKLPLNHKGFELIVREPYVGKLFRPKLTKKVLKMNEKVIVTSKFKENIVVIDSIREEHCLKPDEAVTLRLSKNPLSLIDF